MTRRGLGLGVKIVAVVAVPALLVYAAGRGARTFWRYTGGLGGIFLLTWGPALARQGKPVITDVIGYNGSGLRQWGLVQIAHWLGDPAWESFLIGPGRFVVLAVCALLPAYFVQRRPTVLPAAVGLSLAMFLLLSPAFGIQYAVWPVAGADQRPSREGNVRADDTGSVGDDGPYISRAPDGDRSRLHPRAG